MFERSGRIMKKKKSGQIGPLVPLEQCRGQWKRVLRVYTREMGIRAVPYLADIKRASGGTRHFNRCSKYNLKVLTDKPQILSEDGNHCLSLRLEHLSKSCPDSKL